MGENGRGQNRQSKAGSPTGTYPIRFAVSALALLGGGAVIVVLGRWPGGDVPARVNVSMPATLSPKALAGRRAFGGDCAGCHGRIAEGTDQGPPLVHDIYNPGHHSDAAFLLATQRGVFAHHWNFGNMPPQPQVSREDLAAIVQYVRELQRANGITSKPHGM